MAAFFVVIFFEGCELMNLKEEINLDVERPSISGDIPVYIGEVALNADELYKL